jgi:hypothetical protein
MLKQLFTLLSVVSLFATPVFAEVTYQVSPDGHRVEIYVDDADFSAWIESVPEGERITGCMNSTSSLGIDFYWTIEGVRNGLGFDITGGFIDGTICDAPNWDVTGGRIEPTSLQLNADYVGSSNCAPEIDMSGSRSPGTPRVWSGEYGFPVHAFPHDTEFLGPFPCP